MKHLLFYWRAYAQALVFFMAELILFGAAEGPQKIQFLLYGTIANIMVALAFKYL